MGSKRVATVSDVSTIVTELPTVEVRKTRRNPEQVILEEVIVMVKATDVEDAKEIVQELLDEYDFEAKEVK